MAAIDKKLGGLNRSSATLSGGLGKIGAGIGVGLKRSALIGGAGVAILVDQLGKGIDSLVELEDVTNQTNAVIKSTGGIAGLSSDQIRDLSDRMEELSGVDDKVVQSGANVLMTFTNIRRDAFEPATLAALNMSEAMDQDLQSSMLMIGKALNDPIAGMTALTRAGVQFSLEQKEVIKQLVATGDTAGAQQVILAELNKQFGGSAQASMEGYRGTQLKLADTVEDLQMAFAEALMPAIKNVSDELREFLKDPAVKDGIKDLGKDIAGLFSRENIKGGIDTLKGVFTFLKELPWTAIKDGIAGAADAAKKVVDVFKGLPPGVQAGLLGLLVANKLTGGLVASGLGELAKVALSQLRTITAVNVTVIGANVVGPGIPPVVPGPGGSVSIATALVNALKVAGPLAFVAVSVKGDTPLVHNDPLMNQGIALKTEILNVHGALTNITSLFRSDAETQALIADRARLSAEYLRLFPQAEQQGSSDTARLIREWAAPLLITTNTTQMAIVHALTPAATAALQGAQAQATLKLYAPAATAAIEAARIKGAVTGLIPNINAVGFDVNKTIPVINAVGINVSRLAQPLQAAQGFLGNIQASSARTAAKDLSVDLTVRTSFNVSAREIAFQVQRIADLHANAGQ